MRYRPIKYPERILCSRDGFCVCFLCVCVFVFVSINYLRLKAPGNLFCSELLNSDTLLGVRTN